MSESKTNTFIETQRWGYNHPTHGKLILSLHEQFVSMTPIAFGFYAGVCNLIPVSVLKTIYSRPHKARRARKSICAITGYSLRLTLTALLTQLRQWVSEPRRES